MGDQTGWHGALRRLKMGKRVLFYYLSGFQIAGGIEMFNRSIIKALEDVSDSGLRLEIISVHDVSKDPRYTAQARFSGFGGNRFRSLLRALRVGLWSDIVILGHVNLIIAGLLIKVLHPSARVVLICHGIEVWKRLPFLKRFALRQIDSIWAMSNYTRNQLILNNGVRPSSVILFRNTIGPYFNPPEHRRKPDHLLNRYGIPEKHVVLLTVCRLASTEIEKGYDKVIAILPDIIKEQPGIVYLLCGRYEKAEAARIMQLAASLGVSQHVLMPGFVDEGELIDHYLLADLFVMPSSKEGFGIVFVEALACGTKVIGGNQDGTMDALKNGSFGRLVNPGSAADLTAAILAELGESRRNNVAVRKQVLDEYGYARFVQKVEQLINY